MRSLVAAVLAVLVSATGLAADREDQKKEWEKRRAEAAARQKEYQVKWGWWSLTYSLPGGFALIGRLDLTDEQKKTLGEVASAWTKERREATAELQRQLPKMTAEDYKDPDRRKAYYDKRKELAAKLKVEPPVDRVCEVLTEKQLDKIGGAHQIIVAWSKWVQETVPAYEKRLTDAVGPAPEKETTADRYMFSRLAPALPGATLLGRLGLPEETTKELRKVAGWGFAPGSAARRRAALELLKSQKVPARSATAVREAVMGGETERRTEKRRQAVKGLLAADHVQRLAKGAAIVKERDEAVAKKYAECVEKLNKVLPPRKVPTATAPAVEAPVLPKQAGEIIAAWNQWLVEELPKFDAKLDGILGPEAGVVTSRQRYQYQRLEYVMKGASVLARLGLTDKQLAAVAELGRASYAKAYQERNTFTQFIAGAKIDKTLETAVKNALENTKDERSRRRTREAVRKILTLDQWAKFSQGLKIVEERDEAIRRRHDQVLSDLEKVLPPEKEGAGRNKAGAPAGGRPNPYHRPRRGQ